MAGFQKTFEAGPNTFYASCTVNKNTLGVPHDPVHLQNIFKKYIHGFTACCAL